MDLLKKAIGNFQKQTGFPVTQTLDYITFNTLIASRNNKNAVETTVHALKQSLGDLTGIHKQSHPQETSLEYFIKKSSRYNDSTLKITKRRASDAVFVEKGARATLRRGSDALLSKGINLLAIPFKGDDISDDTSSQASPEPASLPASLAGSEDDALCEITPAFFEINDDNESLELYKLNTARMADINSRSMSLHSSVCSRILSLQQTYTANIEYCKQELQDYKVKSDILEDEVLKVEQAQELISKTITLVGDEGMKTLYQVELLARRTTEAKEALHAFSSRISAVENLLLA